MTLMLAFLWTMLHSIKNKAYTLNCQRNKCDKTEVLINWRVSPAWRMTITKQVRVLRLVCVSVFLWLNIVRYIKQRGVIECQSVIATASSSEHGTIEEVAYMMGPLRSRFWAWDEKPQLSFSYRYGSALETHVLTITTNWDICFSLY